MKPDSDTTPGRVIIGATTITTTGPNTAPPSPLVEALHRQDLLLSDLADHLGELTSRLSRVLVGEQTVDKLDEAEARMSSSPAVNDIQANNDRLAQVIEALDRLTRRLTV